FDIVAPICLLIVCALIRGSRPFLPEILLLEQCPLRDSDPRVITAKRRAKSLHSPMNSELSGRFLSVSFILFWMFASTLYTMVWVRGIATGYWDWGLVMLLGLFPAAMWVVAGISVLIRLLNYLDTRIRLEGWEVELSVRAEAMRQFGEEAGLSGPRRDPPKPATTPDSQETVAAMAAAASVGQPATATADATAMGDAP
ncbi:MAG: hypothetical protein HKN47_06585, partial [Pirellulaceae bacterium]|nr:hypothetical protein [Pirellulaceae bacterium]